MSPDEREALAPLRSDAGFYGILRPRERESNGVKSADRETALLFLTLTEPAPIPQYVTYASDPNVRRQVLRLVAEDVLQVDLGAGFVSGADAVNLYASNANAREGGTISALSRAALRYAQALPLQESGPLANRIYEYNRLPLTPRWRRLLSQSENHASYLGIAAGGPAARALSRGWHALSFSSEWLAWGRRLPGPPATGGVTFKLYVSPTPEALANGGFAAVVSALSSTRAAQFKVGAGAAGLLRPDKLVAYFPDFETLAESVSRVRERLAGMPAHGVPFTAELGGNGLLSWGIDPPHAPGLARGSRESWRFWLARRLAQAMVSARGAREPWRFAMERLELEGIDTDTWTPQLSIFKEA